MCNTFAFHEDAYNIQLDMCVVHIYLKGMCAAHTRPMRYVSHSSRHVCGKYIPIKDLCSTYTAHEECITCSTRANSKNTHLYEDMCNIYTLLKDT